MGRLSFIYAILFIFAGLISIGLSIYLIELSYLALGLVAMFGGLYLIWMLAMVEQLQEDLQREREEQVLPRIRNLENGNKVATTNTRKDTHDKETLPSLNSEQLYIIQRLFIDEYRIHLKSLEGGFSNYGIFQVILQKKRNSKRRKPGFVVKFLSNDDVSQELSVYRENGILEKYPLNFIPGRPVRSWPPDSPLPMNDNLGAVVYSFTMLKPTSQLRTLKSIYKQRSFDNIKSYLELLFEELTVHWYTQNDFHVQHLGGPKGEYERLYRRRRDIRDGISKLIKSSNATDPFVPKFDNLQSIKLPFLPEDWQNEEFYNPTYWINQIFEPEQAQCFNAISSCSPVHGDLHSGNILIEEAGKGTHIWLIDFPNAHIGPSLQDFAAMEADIKFSLIDMEKCTFEDWLRFEKRLFSPLRTSGRALNWPFQEQPPDSEELHKAWQLIEFLRGWVVDNNLIGANIQAYYLALLHCTLPIVYRDAYTKIQKRCALTSAAWMCEHLI